MIRDVTEVYVSAVREDDKYLDQLLLHFAPLLKEDIRVRSERDVSLGLRIETEIKHMIDAARFAILLLSASYIASSEFERDWLLLQAVNTSRKIEIIPVYVEHCNLYNIPLARARSFNNSNAPISSLNSTERSMIWINLATMIYQKVQGPEADKPEQALKASGQKTVGSIQPVQESSMQDDEEDLVLTGAVYEELVKALNSAFPKRSDLERLVFFKLGENLNVIAGEGNLEYVAFTLAGWAESHGKVRALVRGASAQNPDNRLLKAFIKRYL